MKKYDAPKEDSYAYNREILKKKIPWECGLCSHRIKRSELTVDHIVPVSRGGTHEIANLRLVHAKCNEIKGDRLDSEFNIFLRFYFGFLKLIRIFYP